MVIFFSFFYLPLSFCILSLLSSICLSAQLVITILFINHCIRCIVCRLSPQLSQEVMLDEVSDAALVDMLWETQIYLYEKREVLQSLAKLLLNN